MNIKNYTSSVPAHQTIAEIENKLAAAGATNITKAYSPNRQVVSLIFQTELGGKHYAIRVPANVQKCYEALWREHCKRTSRPKESTKGTIMAQAERTAWKIVQEWIEIQLSMIAMQQAQFLEVFLPYVWDGKNTYYEFLDGQKFKQLPESTTHSYA